MTEETWRQLGYGCRGRGCDTCFCECQTPDHLTKLMDGAVADLQALRESPLPVQSTREKLLRRPSAVLDPSMDDLLEGTAA